MELNKESIWTDSSAHQKYRAINELVKDSQSDGSYYTLLVLSSIIISAGLLLANSAVLIGGMLITPVLTPMLLISLGIVTSKPRILKKTSLLIMKSFGVIIAISFLAGLMFQFPESDEFLGFTLFNNSITAAFLYFVVAFASGIAATFAWVRKEVTNILPGISIAVALVPPVSMVGIFFATGEFDLGRFFMVVFLLNIVGIILGSLIVFSLLKFYKTDRVLENTINKMEEEHIKEELEKINNKNLQ